MTKTKILITGATGFIGQNLIEQLSKNNQYEITGVYYKREPSRIEGVKYIRADLTNSDVVKNILSGYDILIHAAATTSGSKDIVQKPFIHVTDNAVMTALLLRSAYECRVKKVIFFSCTIMYQSSRNAIKENDFSESDAIHPNYFGAGWTKVYNEKMCEFFSRISETQYTVLRHSNIYGPHDKFDLEKSHVFGATITKVLTNTDGKIHVWGKGNETRDFLFVDDLCDAVGLVLKKENSKYAIYNVGGGSGVTIKELVEKIIKLSHKKLEIIFDTTKPNIETHIFLDNSKITMALGWEPHHHIDDGIKKTIKWYRENILNE